MTSSQRTVETSEYAATFEPDPYGACAYEKDDKFIEYITLLFEHSLDETNLVDSDKVFSSIRRKYDW